MASGLKFDSRIQPLQGGADRLLRSDFAQERVSSQSNNEVGTGDPGPSSPKDSHTPPPELQPRNGGGHLSLSEKRASNDNSTPTIQKRMVTFGSAHPLNSK